MPTKQRQSNIELLCIIAMFMILLFHANFFSLGTPSAANLSSDTIPTFIRFLGQSFCVGAVNTFVLISGWFGIKTTWKGLANLLFQCFFIMVLVYAACIGLGITSFSIEGIKACLMLTTDFWFIKAYIGLFLLSPFLNAYIEKTSNRQLISFLVVFYIFQTIYGWVVNAAEFIQGGYSTFSFVGLYVLARTCRINSEKLSKYKGSFYGFAYLILIILIALIAIFGIYTGKSAFCSMMYAYSNPLVIASSMLLVYWFSTFSIQSKIINWVAASSLTVYLIHMHYYVKNLYRDEITDLWTSYSHLTAILLIIVLCIGVFVLSVLVDKIRIACWNYILKLQSNKEKI
ncbi:acyltransferase family protein [Bacteroides nordii]|uniref:acyltransferase family protein n=1 Tax=Bacteroides nordii TaxID=291645 RepID=UPI0021095E85|nr:acyltransferase family protein [Bacteroides nordii]MCQ4913693.1 acyltransferase family protein [Bacteroides nordii]